MSREEFNELLEQLKDTDLEALTDELDKEVENLIGTSTPATALLPKPLQSEAASPQSMAAIIGNSSVSSDPAAPSSALAWRLKRERVSTSLQHLFPRMPRSYFCTATASSSSSSSILSANTSQASSGL
jgi:hypothetical protein